MTRPKPARWRGPEPGPLRAGARLLLGALLALASHAAASNADSTAEPAAATGTWTLRTWTNHETDSTEYALTFSWTRGPDHWGSRSWALDPIPGLDPRQVAGAISTVHFILVRDAGTFACDGHVGNGDGAGLYAFKLDPAYTEALAKRGIGRPTVEQQVQLALGDVTFAFLNELKDQHYPTPTVALLITLDEHGVNRNYVDGMSALGCQPGSFDTLLRLRDHGVDPRYVRGMREAGFTTLSLDELLHARDHGVNQRYVRDMADAGYEHLSLEQLLRTRDQGVNARYIRAMAEAGYTNVPLEDLVRARNHGVDARVARRINGRLEKPATLERLIQIHDRGGLE